MCLGVLKTQTCPANQKAWLTGESFTRMTAVLLLHPHSIRKVNLVGNNTLGKTSVLRSGGIVASSNQLPQQMLSMNLPSHKLAQSRRD
jgi:hypothetical protein